jgi:malonyl-CoA O-methyltransferase
MLSIRKQKIENSFGSKVASYNRHAFLQKESAQKLCFFLPEIAPLKILEIGCGTGFLTQELQKKYPESEILSIDISKEMIKACTQKFLGYNNFQFNVMDGEHFHSSEKFDLIISNLSIQWFEKPLQGLKDLTKFLTDDGVLFYTTIGKKSFQEWKDILTNLNLSSGIIGSPDYEGIFQEDKKIISYKNSLDFLRNFKKIGAHQPRPDYVPLTSSQLKQACTAHDTAYNGQITWHILYGALDSSSRALHR